MAQRKQIFSIQNFSHWHSTTLGHSDFWEYLSENSIETLGPYEIYPFFRKPMQNCIDSCTNRPLKVWGKVLRKDTSQCIDPLGHHILEWGTISISQKTTVRSHMNWYLNTPIGTSHASVSNCTISLLSDLCRGTSALSHLWVVSILACLRVTERDHGGSCSIDDHRLRCELARLVERVLSDLKRHPWAKSLSSAWDTRYQLKAPEMHFLSVFDFSTSDHLQYHRDSFSVTRSRRL